MSKLVASVGHLPAAIVNATHYFEDNFATDKPNALGVFLVKWERSEAVKCGLLHFRRKTFIYPHTIQASFEVSLNRLKKNLMIERSILYTCSLYLLRFLCIMKIYIFPRSELESLCALIGEFVNSEKTKDEILNHLSSDDSVAYRCVTELVHVSLLSHREESGFLLLNSLTKASVWLAMRRDMGEMAQLENLLARASKFVARSWTPCLPTYNPSETGEAGLATFFEAADT